jgi:hypothetical protein
MGAAMAAGRRTLWLALAIALVVAAIVLAVGLTTGSDRVAPKRPAPVASIPRGSSPEQQARNLAEWLRRYSR